MSTMSSALFAAASAAASAAVVPSEALVRIDGTGGVVRLVLVVLGMAVLAAAIRWVAGLGNGRDEVVAATRATVQLGVVGALIAVVLGSWGLTLGFVVLMTVVASVTAAGRMQAVPRWWASVPIVLGAIPVTAVLLGVGLLPWEPIAVIPTAGILVGNAMTATSLAGRRCLESLAERRGEREAALALGLMPRDAALLVCQDAARLALIPGLDQTRTVGLVTLPGAFVGTLLGGASPMEAAALQLVVLVGILLGQSVAVALTLELVVRDRIHQPAA